MSGGAAIGPGSRVTLRYRLSLDDGSEVDASGDEPLTFTIGDATLAPGLEEALFGLRPGSEEWIVLAPGEAFGLPEPDLLHRLPRADFPEEMSLEEGAVILFTTPSGEEIAGTVTALEEREVAVDFNHPLAGRALLFEVEILAVGEVTAP